MKKGTGKTKQICGRKWRLISIVFILIFSIFVISGALEKVSTGDQESPGITSGPKIIKVQATENQENTAGTLGLNLQPAPATSENTEGLQIIQKNEEPQIQADESMGNPGKVVDSNPGLSTEENKEENNVVDNAINRQEAPESEKSQIGHKTASIGQQTGAGNTPEVINSANEGSDGQGLVQEKKSNEEFQNQENADEPAEIQGKIIDKQKEEPEKNIIIVKNEEKPENPEKVEETEKQQSNSIGDSPKNTLEDHVENNQNSLKEMDKEKIKPEESSQNSQETGKEEIESQSEENAGPEGKEENKDTDNVIVETEEIDKERNNKDTPEVVEKESDQKNNIEDSADSPKLVNDPENAENNKEAPEQEQSAGEQQNPITKETEISDGQQTTQPVLYFPEQEQATDTYLDGQQPVGEQEKEGEQNDGGILDIAEQESSTGQDTNNAGKENKENPDSEAGSSLNIIKENEGANPTNNPTTDRIKEIEINRDSAGLGKTEEKTEITREVFPAAKSQKCEIENSKVKMKPCIVTYSSGNKGMKSEPKIVAFNWTCPKKTENETQNLEPEVNPGENKSKENCSGQNESEENKTEEDSWQNIKFILSHTYSFDSFYTAYENVKVGYDGPESLAGQRVDVYLVKKNTQDLSEEEISGFESGVYDSSSFEELVRKDTESYVQIPAVLDEKGDLLPLTFDPLPAGDYWTVITLAGGEDGEEVNPSGGSSESDSTSSSEPENQKQILSANYFKVLEYGMRAEVPGAVKEGEDFEVNLSLEGQPDQLDERNYTYWAVLINEDAYKANLNGNSGGIEIGIENFLTGINFIVGSGSDSPTGSKETASSNSELSKAKFKMEVQKLIGEDKGAITLGEENQKNLSLTSVDLVPGNYFLFAGAYEKDKGLLGIVQKKLTIYAPKVVYLDGKASASPEESSGSDSIKKKLPSILESKDSIFNSLGTVSFESLSPKIGDAAVQAGIIIKNPPKIPSLILGFIITLLSGLAIIKIRRQP